MPWAVASIGFRGEEMVREAMRASEVTHCGAAFLWGLPWKLYEAAMDEARLMSKERARAK